MFKASNSPEQRHKTTMAKLVLSSCLWCPLFFLDPSGSMCIEAVHRENSREAIVWRGGIPYKYANMYDESTPQHEEGYQNVSYTCIL